MVCRSLPYTIKRRNTIAEITVDGVFYASDKYRCDDIIANAEIRCPVCLELFLSLRAYQTSLSRAGYPDWRSLTCQRRAPDLRILFADCCPGSSMHIEPGDALPGFDTEDPQSGRDRRLNLRRFAEHLFFAWRRSIISR